MPLRLDIKRKFLQRSDRVKCVDIHPTEPWLLTNLYNGNIYLWNYNTAQLVKSFEVTELPVRSAKFIARKGWIVCGADDMIVRVFNYNTMDKVKAFEAHTDYIRCVAVHPTLPYLLTSSDDMLIKLWDWDKNWVCTQVFEGHAHYVMQVAFNPKDTNTFASASLDRTVKVWSLGQPSPNFTLEGHEKGVNCVDYFAGGDRPYLVTGADDKLVKVWDYQTKSCVQTLEGHSHNVSTVCYHPELPIIITGSEDGTLRLWHAQTYRLENTLNYGMERVWAIAALKGTNKVALGFDEGSLMIKLGREEPVASMDTSGKVIWARHNEIQTVNIKSVAEADVTDGERLPVAIKDLGSSDLYPQTLSHAPNGRFVSVCGDGEYVIYTALAWRNKCFGQALEFVWAADPSEYATRNSASQVTIYKNFAVKKNLRLGFSAEGIFGGTLLGVRAADFIVFYDWAEGRIVRRVDVGVKTLYWSDAGDLLSIISEASFYILKFSPEVVADVVASGRAVDEAQGIEEAFELLHEVGDKVRTALWVGDCFIYTTAAWRLNYCVGGEVTTLFHLDRPMYLLGYMATQNRLYLIDKEFGVVSYTLLLSVIEYKTLVLRGAMDAAAAVLPSIKPSELLSVARFLESRGLLREALDIAPDAEYKFGLAIQLGDLAIAQEIALDVGSEAKWKQLGELALAAGKLPLAEDCLHKAADLPGLLMLHSATGSAAGMRSLADLARSKGRSNIAFVCLLLLGDVSACLDLLVDSGRLPEAAFFARTYAPSKVSALVALWREDLKKVNAKASESLADPARYPNLFPDWEHALAAEQLAVKQREAVVPATAYSAVTAAGKVDLVALVKQLAEGGILDGALATGALAANGAAGGHVGGAAVTGEDDDDDEGGDEGDAGEGDEGGEEAGGHPGGAASPAKSPAAPASYATSPLPPQRPPSGPPSPAPQPGAAIGGEAAAGVTEEEEDDGVDAGDFEDAEGVATGAAAEEEDESWGLDEAADDNAA